MFTRRAAILNCVAVTIPATVPVLNNKYIRIHKWALVDPAYVKKLELCEHWNYVRVLMLDNSLIESCSKDFIDPRQIIFDIEQSVGRCLIGTIEHNEIRFEGQDLAEVPGIIWDGPRMSREECERRCKLIEQDV